jgi:hypothetical protein
VELGRHATRLISACLPFLICGTRRVRIHGHQLLNIRQSEGFEYLIQLILDSPPPGLHVARVQKVTGVMQFWRCAVCRISCWWSYIVIGNFQNYFSIEKDVVAWGDFLEFLELFFNRERWHGMRWCVMVLKFSEFFFNEEKWCDMRWFSWFLELFFNRERWCDMLLNF